MELFFKAGEVKLMQMLKDIAADPFGWRAVHFHLSRLLEEYKSEYQARIALNLIHDLLKGYEGGIFLLHDHGIIVLCQRLEKPLQDKLVFQLRYLYMDDPLAYSDTGQENPEFATAYDLRHRWNEFHDICSRALAASGRRPFPEHKPADKPLRPASESAGKAYPRLSLDAPSSPPAEESPAELPEVVAERRERGDKKEFSASSLALIESDLAHADLHRTIRRQPVCALPPEGKIRRVFDELYIHIAHLRRMLHSEVDFLSNRWLFKYLTRVLDERMLEHLRRHQSRYLDVPISINLNVETLLSDAFAEFDAALKPQAKVAVVIEVPVIDVFADMDAFQLARREAQKLGYRICLDGLTAASFTSINREKLGLDLVKVQWHGELKAENHDLTEAVRVAGGNRIILCRCDGKAAVEYGHALGISLFQGRYLDSLLNPDAKVVN